MTNNDDFFDDLFRQKLEQRSFTPGPESWAKAQQLIDGKGAASSAAAGAAAKGGLLSVTGIVICSAIVAAIAVAGYIFIPGVKENLIVRKPAQQKIISAQPDQKSGSEISAAENEKHAITLSTGNTSHESGVQPNEQPNFSSKEIAAQQHSAAPNKNRASSSAAANAKRTSSPASIKSSAQPDRDRGKLENRNVLPKVENGISSAEENLLVENMMINSSTEKSAEENTAKTSSENVSVGKAETLTVSSSTNESSATEKTPENTSASPAENPQQSVSSSGESAVENQGSTTPVEDRAQTTASQPATTGSDGNQNSASTGSSPTDANIARNEPAAGNETAPATAELPSANTTDGTNEKPESGAGEIPTAQVKNSGTNFWFVNAGATFIPGFNNGNISGRSINPVIGGGYHFRLANNFSMQAALNYTCIGNASDSNKTITEIDYSFGSAYYVTTTRLHRMHYASVPVTVWWHLDAKNSIFGGGTLNYLFTNESRVPATGDISIPTEITRFSYYAGANHFDALANIGYARNFGRRWNAQLSFYYGLSDLKINSYFGVDRVERNKGLQLMIQYTF
jgi:hypothetical protein